MTATIVAIILALDSAATGGIGVAVGGIAGGITGTWLTARAPIRTVALDELRSSLDEQRSRIAVLADHTAECERLRAEDLIRIGEERRTFTAALSDARARIAVLEYELEALRSGT